MILLVQPLIDAIDVLNLVDVGENLGLIAVEDHFHAFFKEFCRWIQIGLSVVEIPVDHEPSDTASEPEALGQGNDLVPSFSVFLDEFRNGEVDPSFDSLVLVVVEDHGHLVVVAVRVGIDGLKNVSV